MRRSMLLLLSLVVLGFGQPANFIVTGLIAPVRRVDWTKAGIRGVAIGALPDGSWPTCVTAACNTLAGGTVTTTSVTNAINSAPLNSVVTVPAGSYTLSGWNFSGINGVALRGAGADQTLLTLDNDTGACRTITGFVGICISPSSSNYNQSIQNGPVNLTGTFPKGQTALTFATVPNLKVGNIVMVDQTDDTVDDGSILISQDNTPITAGSPACAGNGNVPPCGTIGPVSLEGNGGGAQRTGREQMQVVTVVSCNGVSTIGSACSGSNVAVVFAPGLAMPNWASGRSPQAWWASDPVHDIGIEDMSIDFTGAGSVPGIGIGNAYNIWIRGIRSINTNRSHVQIDYAQHVTVRDSYFFLTLNSQSQSYGVECDGAADVLVENNIMQAVTAPLMVNGSCSGAVFGYNFTINNYYTGSSRYNIPGILEHTAGIDNVLYEGNYGNTYTTDVFHGSHHFATVFRNRLTGPQPACWVSGSPYSSATFGSCTNPTSAIDLRSYGRFLNFVGNVLGTTGTNTTYASVWGTIGGGNTNGTVTVPDDPNVLPTLLRWGNADSATGFGSPRFNSSEVPSGLTGTQAPYKNPIPATHNLPYSLYRGVKPPWWPSAKPWPPIGPDVTGGNVANVGGRVYTLPAQDCFLNTMGGPSDGTGPVLTFNRGLCYPLS